VLLWTIRLNHILIVYLSPWFNATVLLRIQKPKIMV